MSQKEKVRIHFNEYAKYWHEKLNVYSFKARRDSVRQLVEGREFQSVLDIGCGCGDYASLFGKDRKYLGIDISKDMVSTARRLYPNYSFQVGDAEETGLEDASWDLVMSVAVFEYLDDPKKHMKEMSRLVKRGGAVVLSVQNAEDVTKSRDEAIVRKLEALRGIKKRLLPAARVVARENPAKDPGIIHHRHSEEELRRLGMACNLQLIERAFVKVGMIPGLFDQYLNFNAMCSELLQIWPFRVMFRNYIRSHSRCLTLMFEKV